jgi:uncharacterized phiE125 gp8 family phage protein
MKTGLSVQTAAAEEPVTLAEIKSHMKVTSTAEDTYITALAKAARSYIEDVTGRVALTTVFDYTADRFPSDVRTMELPRSALSGVTYVKYYDQDGVLQTLDAAQYIVVTDSEPGYVYLRAAYYWPTTEKRPGAVQIRFSAGWTANAAGLGADKEGFKLAIKFLVHHWHSLRTPVNIGNLVSNIPNNFDLLLQQFRVFDLQ